MTEVAIIGNGAASAAVFCSLVEHAAASTIHWLGHDRTAGRGMAYAAQGTRGLLNVRAAGMRLKASDPCGFMDYLETHQPGTRGSAFVPRVWFGDYIAQQVERYRTQASATGIQVHTHTGRAIAMQPDGQPGFGITLDSGRQIHADQAVLACGALPPRPLDGVSAETLASGAYSLDPLNIPSPARAPRRVVVIGSGLTAVDTLIEASSHWPDAELIAISRHGRFPSRHSDQGEPADAGQPALHARLLADSRPAAVLHALRAAIHSRPEAWRAIIDGLRPINSRLWQAWGPDQQRLFLRHLSSHWDRARHRMPPASADRIQSLQDSGRLRLLAARVKSVAGTGPVRIQLLTRGGTAPRIQEADLVIQACGLNTRMEAGADPLLDSMLDHGLLVPAPFGLGLKATPQGQLLDRHDQPQPGLYSIGSPLRGVLWECTAMPEISQAGQALAGHIAGTRPVADSALPAC